MPKPFDLLSELAKFSVGDRISLRDPQVAWRFATHAGTAASKALLDQTLLHGQRTQAMFEAMLLSFDDHTLLKVEDTGQVHPKSRFQVPDFRVVLSEGTQWLIEVKNIYIEDPSRQKRLLMNPAYRKKLEAYAYATGGQLKLALYWAKWSIWTLVSPERLVDAEGYLTLDMQTAIRVSELGRLGDRMIGTRPPLKLRLTPDQASISPVAPDGMVQFTIARAQIYCGEDEVLDPVEQQIAWMFMHYGQWEGIGPQPLLEDGQLKTIEFRWEPEERANEDQDFEIIGTLSRMLGAPKAITATARKIATIYFRMLATGEEFIELGQDAYERQYQQRLLSNLRRKATRLGFSLVPDQSIS